MIYKLNFYFLVSLMLLSCFPKTNQQVMYNRNNAFDVKNKKIAVYTTAKNTEYRISFIDTLLFSPKSQPVENEISIIVDPHLLHQTYIGVGGAITDAAAETFYKMPKEKQEQILKAYFDEKDGIGYSIIRTNINSCDFSSDNYTYVSDFDKELNTFNIEHDKKYKIPFIKEALRSANNNCIIYASPWSPPAWMKDNKNMLKGGKLLRENYSIWANYFVKFINAYEREGLKIWGVSIQNEPMATQRWESCIYTAEEERDFLKYHLGPTFYKSGLKDKKIIVWDHNRDLIYQRAKTYFSDKETSKYIWGIGFHWYETWSGSDPMFNNIKQVNQSFPDKNIFFTEGCKEEYKIDQINEWSLGEKYGFNMINDFNNGMVGFTDWNILLDEKGGPNHANNFCFAPIHGNTKTGEIMFTNEYYYIGHFSKFIKKGARRIISSCSRSTILSTAFRNPDGTIVVIVMNPNDTSVQYDLWMDGKATKTESLPRSISTLLIK